MRAGGRGEELLLLLRLEAHREGVVGAVAGRLGLETLLLLLGFKLLLVEVGLLGGGLFASELLLLSLVLRSATRERERVSLKRASSVEKGHGRRTCIWRYCC